VRHDHTYGGGDSEYVFALCALLGFQFAPHIPGLKHRRLYSFGKPSGYPMPEPMIAGRINAALIRAHWLAILRIVASIHTGTVTTSLIMRQLACYPRQNGVAAALRELGRLERTLFTLDWVNAPELRRTTGQELNKGESRNSPARAAFIHRLIDRLLCVSQSSRLLAGHKKRAGGTRAPPTPTLSNPIRSAATPPPSPPPGCSGSTSSGRAQPQSPAGGSSPPRCPPGSAARR
jgi:hypothetical protein